MPRPLTKTRLFHSRGSCLLSPSHILTAHTVPSYLAQRSCRDFRRTFSSTRSKNATHYETLGIPPTSSRLQVKAAFYKLSKLLHPDVNPDEACNARFIAVSDAYRVIGNERQRRAYDKTLMSSAPATTSGAAHSRSHPNYADLSRRPGATHAWEHTRRNRPPPPPRPGPDPGHKRYHYPSAPQYQPHAHSSGRTGRGTDQLNSRLSEWDKAIGAEERVQRESGVMRVVQVVSLLGIIFAFAGGLR